jgi:acyl-CoA thioester hydrolase
VLISECKDVKNFLKKKMFFYCFFENIFVHLPQIFFRMYYFETQLRVRYGETDKMGYVYYGNYPAYYEVARNESMRNLGVTYREMEESGVMLPVHDLRIEYKKAAHYDDLLTIKIWITEMPVAKLSHRYEIYNEQGELLNKGTTALVFVDSATMKLCRCPEWFSKLLQPYFA